MWAWIREFHDRLVAVAVLIALIMALLQLAAGLVDIKAKYAAFKNEVDGQKPRYPVQESVQPQGYDVAVAALEKPFLLAEGSNAVWNPERRVRCSDCKKPIPVDVAKCTFCFAATRPPVIPPERLDSDGDGLNDSVEAQWGLDPANPRDAAGDIDDDGATNLEEFLAHTDPKDPASCPELVATKLVVQKIVPNPFPLLFMTVNTNFSGGARFTINTLANDQTVTVKMGEKVLGYELVRFEPKQELKSMNIITQVIDTSVLTLKKGDKEIALVKGEKVQVEDYRAHLLLLSDKSVREVGVDGAFDLKNKKYTVIAIDMKGQFVVVKRDNDGRTFRIGKTPAEGGAGPDAKALSGAEAAR
jgi:hypothetical protein